MRDRSRGCLQLLWDEDSACGLGLERRLNQTLPSLPCLFTRLWLQFYLEEVGLDVGDYIDSLGFDGRWRSTMNHDGFFCVIRMECNQVELEPRKDGKS